MGRNRQNAVVAALAAVLMTGAASPFFASEARAEETGGYLIGIVEQQLANPFFAMLQQSAVSRAQELGLETMTAESLVAGDSATQVNAIENMINRGVKGIVLDPGNAYALVPIVKRARDEGIIVVLDSRVLTKRYGKLFLDSPPKCPTEIV